MCLDDDEESKTKQHNTTQHKENTLLIKQNKKQITELITELIITQQNHKNKPCYLTYKQNIDSCN